jgi:hypothetical protein
MWLRRAIRARNAAKGCSVLMFPSGANLSQLSPWLTIDVLTVPVPELHVFANMLAGPDVIGHDEMPPALSAAEEFISIVERPNL